MKNVFLKFFLLLLVVFVADANSKNHVKKNTSKHVKTTKHVNLQKVNASSSLKTYIEFNNTDIDQIPVDFWLSFSCSHCSNYFQVILNEMTRLKKLSIRVHFLPHLYKMDLPIVAFVFSQPERSLEIAKLFFENQSQWLQDSDEGENNPEKREKDKQNAIKWLERKKQNSLDKKALEDYLTLLDNFLSAHDDYLYLKIFLLKNNFSIKEIDAVWEVSKVKEKYAKAVTKDVPTDGKYLINMAPFIQINGLRANDKYLDGGIFTISKAKQLIKEFDYKDANFHFSGVNHKIKQDNYQDFDAVQDEDNVLSEKDLTDNDSSKDFEDIDDVDKNKEIDDIIKSIESEDSGVSKKSHEPHKKHNSNNDFAKNKNHQNKSSQNNGDLEQIAEDRINNDDSESQESLDQEDVLDDSWQNQDQDDQDNNAQSNYDDNEYSNDSGIEDNDPYRNLSDDSSYEENNEYD